jgi:hypothetical protein
MIRNVFGIAGRVDGRDSGPYDGGIRYKREICEAETFGTPRRGKEAMTL